MIDIAEFERDGFAITKPLFSLREVQRITSVIEEQTPGGEERRGGVRDVLDNLPAIRDLADHPSIRTIVNEILGIEAFVVRATLFDKSASSNWKVPWHQDVTIAVSERIETPGFGPWSIKAGVTHVQPPSQILEHMVTVRVHLDDCPASNGALCVMPGTHNLGRLNQNEVCTYINEAAAISCEANIGEALVMRPLLLHASSVAEHPGHRRVLHFDYANSVLPGGLKWRMQEGRSLRRL